MRIAAPFYAANISKSCRKAAVDAFCGVCAVSVGTRSVEGACPSMCQRFQRDCWEDHFRVSADGLFWEPCDIGRPYLGCTRLKQIAHNGTDLCNMVGIPVAATGFCMDGAHAVARIKEDVPADVPADDVSYLAYLDLAYALWLSFYLYHLVCAHLQYYAVVYDWNHSGLWWKFYSFPIWGSLIKLCKSPIKLWQSLIKRSKSLMKRWKSLIKAKQTFRDLTDTIHDHLTCAVCLHTLTNAVALENCGHTFCEACARGVAAGPSPKCPECRRAFRSYHPAVVLRKVVSTVPVVID